MGLPWVRLDTQNTLVQNGFRVFQDVKLEVKEKPGEDGNPPGRRSHLYGRFDMQDASADHRRVVA